MTTHPLRIIQISDSHLFADASQSLLGVNTEESFQAVVSFIKNAAGKIDLIIHSGDLSQDGSKESYERVAQALKELQVPVYYIPGNHDNVRTLTAVYPIEPISGHKHIVLKNWHIILLNSQKPGCVEGYLDASQLTYLQHCLQTYPEHQAIIVFHHQPVLMGCAWLDNLGLKNADEFWQLISGYPKVNSVLFGHVHQENVQMVNGVKCYSVPSTCIQFARDCDEFGLENLPPGYRWIDLHEDGFLETGVQRIEKYVGKFDKHAKGY